MAPENLPTRLVICIDGTYCTADGPDGKGHGNISNVYRICASVKQGVCYDEAKQQSFCQKKHYEPGIGSADEVGSWQRLKSGVWGDGFKDIIQKVYKECCKLDARDEVWLYGFSRGAYIARAVAGLLYYIGALTSADGPQFEAEYSKALKVYGNSEKRSLIGPGQIHQFVSLSTKPKPTVKFLGLFDTVKAVEDEGLHDISFNDSIQHLRHALALGEDRKAMTPEYVFPDYGNIRSQLSNRSIVQAWFLGAHIDMGGSAEKDGLSLYPLQWMLLESQSKGLILEFSNHQTRNDDPLKRIDNPLEVVFPKHEADGKGMDPWSCTTDNRIQVRMQDLRRVHELQKYRSRYAIDLNRQKAHLWPRRTRQPFNTDGSLRGYCSFASQGTIIHPSVYQLLDECLHVGLHKKAWDHRENTEKWRPKMLHESNDLVNQGFWSNRGTLEIDDLKSIRILVCGNTGVGKSTLINRVFGVEVPLPESSYRNRGIHRIEDEIIHPERPDLIIHDSGGFEAGDVSQIRSVENFVKKKASRTDLAERLHVIWFCIEMNSTRTKQTATDEVFRAVSTYATDIPVIVVGTKSDEFLGSQFQEARSLYSPLINDAAQLMQACDAYAADQVKNRILLIESEMKEVEGGRFDACVDVGKDDQNSIDRLNQITLNSFNHEKLRLIYVAAQVSSIDMKVDCAIIETMKIYRKILVTSSALGLLPTAPMSNRTAAAISVCRAIIKCFGLPNINTKVIYEIVKCNLWDDLGHNLSIALAEGIATLGLGASVLLGGMPVFLASAVINVPLVVPATTRLMLMLASDLILILTQAFKKTACTCVGQPLVKDVQLAAIHYRPLSSKVHKEVMELVPKRNLAKSFRANNVRTGLEKILYRYKEHLMDAKVMTEDLANIGIRPNESRLYEVKEVKMEIEEMYNDILPSYHEIIDVARANNYDYSDDAKKQGGLVVS